jgi:hypothetical protein
LTICSKKWNVARPGKTVKQKVVPPKISIKGPVHTKLPELHQYTHSRSKMQAKKYLILGLFGGSKLIPDALKVLETVALLA